MPLGGAFTKTGVTWQFLSPCEHQGAPHAQGVCCKYGGGGCNSLGSPDPFSLAVPLLIHGAWASQALLPAASVVGTGPRPPGGQQNSLQTLGTDRAQGGSSETPWGPQSLIQG